MSMTFWLKKSIFLIGLLFALILLPFFTFADSLNGEGKNYRSNREIRFLNIKNVKNAINFDTEIEKEIRKLTSSNASSKRSRVVFTEGVEMDFKGSVYHPKFMNFDVSLEFGPQQDKEKSEYTSGKSKFRNSYLASYRFDSNFLEDKPCSFALFADKDKRVQNRDFFERQTINSSSYGGRLNLNKVFLPLRFSFRRSSEEIGRTFRSEETFNEKVYNLQVAPLIKHLGKIRMDYTRNKFRREEKGLSDQYGTTDDVTISNNYFFGEDTNKSLNSYLRYYSLEGNRSNKDFDWNESLSVRHNENLDTFYRYNFSDSSAQGIDNRQHNLNAGLRHKLYESLAASFAVRGLYLESSSFDETSGGISLNGDYRKNIGFTVLSIGAGCDYEKERRKASETFLYIVDEEHVLTDSVITYLDEARVDTLTIAVANTANTITYTKNVDYEVIEHAGARVEIRRIAAGGISNGDTVSVDYIVRNNPSFSFATLQNNFRFGLSFYKDTVRLYYRLRQQRYPDIKGERNLTLEKVDDVIFGGDVRLGWLNFGVEYEDYESDLTPYDSLRLYENISLSISENSDFTLRSQQNYVNLTDENRRSHEVRGRYSLRFSRSAACAIETGYRWQKGKDIDLNNFISRFTYRVLIGALSFEMGYEYEKERSLADDFTNHYFYTKLKRNF